MKEFKTLNGYAVKDETARNIAKGRNQAVAFDNYEAMITALNALDSTEYKVGQNIYIETVKVPDLWVSSVESILNTFTYTSDDDFVALLERNTTVQVGHYKLAMLETQKVDLTEYAKTADVENNLEAELKTRDARIAELEKVDHSKFATVDGVNAELDEIKESVNELEEHEHEALYKDGYRAVLQSDGNFGVYDSENNVLFNANASHKIATESQDYVVESGVYSDNQYRKWKSGFLEVWTGKGVTVPISNSWGSGWYLSTEQSGLPYPVAFIEAPIVIMDLKTADGSQSYATIIKFTDGTVTHTPSFVLARQGTANSAKYGVQVYAAGRWK